MKTLLCCLMCAGSVSLAAMPEPGDYADVLETGTAEERVALGRLFYEGMGTGRDYEKAARLFYRAAGMGDAEAQYMLAVMYSEGAGLRERPKKAFAWASASARQGHAEASNLLGVFYSDGYGTAQDDAKAAEWFRKAAAAGDSKGAFNLGASFEYGTGVQKDLTQAVDWYRRSAENGSAVAQYSLGTCYEYGMGVARNPGLAAQWYGRASAQGDPRGQLALGICHARGIGVVRNPALAAAWYKKAAEQGYDPARMQLAAAHDAGAGVPVDHARAAELYRAAAEAGHLPAMIPHGLCLEFGRGGEVDPDAARAVYQAAVEAGIDEGRHRLRYMDFDVSAAEAAAEGMKDRTIVFKGLYPGMPIEDAAIVLERRLRAAGDAEPLFVRGEKEGRIVRRGVEIEIDADVDGGVERIFLANRVADRLFDTADSPNAEFIEMFLSAYDDGEAVRSTDQAPIRVGGRTVGSQKLNRFRHARGYELVFYDAYVFNTTGSTRDALAVGACRPMGSLEVRRIASAPERAAHFD